MANYFNDYFISVGRDLTRSIPVLNDSPLQFMGERSPVSMSITSCSSVDVKKVILSMANKRCGLDNVPVKIYKFLVEKLRDVIAFVFNFKVKVNPLFGISVYNDSNNWQIEMQYNLKTQMKKKDKFLTNRGLLLGEPI